VFDRLIARPRADRDAVLVAMTFLSRCAIDDGMRDDAMTAIAMCDR
jgi:hypothetical protein